MVYNMTELVEVVKVQGKRAKPSGTQYFVTIPSDFVKVLGIEKGERLLVRIREIEIDGTKKKALIYYKP